MLFLRKRVGVQMQSPLYQFVQIDRALPGRRRPREVHQVLNNLSRAAGLLVQHHQMLEARLVRFAIL